MPLSEWLEIGRIVGAQGLRGEVRVYPNSDFPERFEQPGTRWLLRPDTSDPEPIELLAGRYIPNKGIYILKLKGVADRTQAEQLRDGRLMVPESDRPPLEEGEFHVLDLIGLTVIDQATQESIGVIVDVISAGNDLLEVQLHPSRSAEAAQEVDESTAEAPLNDKPKAAKSQPTVLIPFVEAIVPIVDLEQKRVEITPPAGLIE